MSKRPIAVDDLFNMKLVSDPQISSDGKTIAFVQTRLDLEENKYRSHLWLVRADGTAPARQFTFGEGKDRAPRWSPDGKWIAFISNREEDKDRLYLIALAGGEARRLTDGDSKPSAAVWSPDGSMIAYTALVFTDATKRANGAREESDVRSYTRLNYKSNSDGFWDYGWRQIFSLSLRREGRGEGRQLTRGNYIHTQPAWSPDGKTMVFVANRTARADERNITDLWCVPAQG
ncbi:MAG: PD40 domain-containing protein, partial [Chloroflexota bacterium]|nr:PD40 domain-containing protein [Chloroflexota bacterium]